MKADLYQQVTDQVIAELERGALPWIKPWRSRAGSGFMPVNIFTGKPYRGINVLLLLGSGSADQRWATFNQCKQHGAHVRKGAKGQLIVFFKPWHIRKVDTATNETTEKTVPMLKAYWLFNVEDIEGLPQATVEQPEQQPEPRIEAADALLAKAEIRKAANAYYVPSADYIGLPELESFRSVGHFYATALHELTHWTGHKSRLDRNLSGRFGDAAYAAEELIAELGSAFLCAELGLQIAELRHAGYVDHWLRLLRQDKRAIIAAASAAQKAADYLHGQQPATEEQPEAAAA